MTTSPLERLIQADTAITTPKDDFKDPQTLQRVRQLADDIVGWGLGGKALAGLEGEATTPDARTQLTAFAQLALKLALAKSRLREANGEVSVSVVLPAYGENVRLLTRDQNPHGEDFVAQKEAQLDWLFAGTPHRYQVVVVDDMSKAEPVTSGEAIAARVNELGLMTWHVLFLKDGVENEKDGDTVAASALRGVEFPKNSRKAGAVYYGAAKAVELFGEDPSHVVVTTDCDLSVDLGQVGNLVYPIISGRAQAVAGSRRLPESILQIEAKRNIRANAARYFRELLLPGLLPLDTQCGAKAFAAPALAAVIRDGLSVLDFSYDIELLTKIALRFGAEQIAPVPVAWFDSAELTTTDDTVHWSIMRTQLAVAQANSTGSGPQFDQAVEVAAKLADDNDVWLGFLDKLQGDSDLVEAVGRRDPAVLPHLVELV